MLEQVLAQLLIYFSALVGINSEVRLTDLPKFPPELGECSGLAAIDSSFMLAINDGGNTAELFVLNEQGRVRQKILLPGLENRDWEALAYLNDTLYIADLGNNANKRRDLRLLRIDFSGWREQEQIKVLAALPVRYAEQEAYPARPQNRHFDVEALCAVQDELWLFTKNRAEPYRRWTYIYRFKPQGDRLVLKRQDSLRLPKGLRETNWITGASYRDSAIWLSSYARLYRLPLNEAGHWNGQYESYRLPHVSQFEAITHFRGNWYLADERNTPQSGRLYRFKVTEK